MVLNDGFVECKNCGEIHDPALWCFCVPQSEIDEFDRRARMVLEGFWDAETKKYDEKGYAAAHYGRHDRSAVGLAAWSIAVDPQTEEWTYEGQHRSGATPQDVGV